MIPKHILIIGGGVIGLCTAYYCARQGHRVTLVERGGEQRDGCSFGNAGMIVPSHFVPLAAPGMVALGLKWMWNPESPFYIKPRVDLGFLQWGWKFFRAANQAHVARSAPLLRDLHLASRTCFEELAQVSDNDFGLVRKGLLMLCKTTHALEEEAKVAEWAQRLGVPAEVLNHKQTTKLNPQIRMDIAGSVYFPKDCHLDPGRFMAGLQRQLTKMGVQCFWNTEVKGWRISKGQIEALLTESASSPSPPPGERAGVRGQRVLSEFNADEYVLCGGSWSQLIARELKLRIPMQAGKGYSLTLSQPRQLPQICAILSEARVAVTPMNGSLRFGGTMEFSGLNEEIKPARVQGIIKAASQYYPDFSARDFEGIKPWYGLRPCSPDGLPYLGRTRRFANLSLATGHAMLGLSLGPISGRLTAEMFSGQKPSIDISLLHPDRYA